MAAGYGEHRLKLAIIVIAAILTVPACSPPSPPPPPPEPEVELKPVFTQSKFDQILFGMTYGDVADLLGAESSRQESTYEQGESEYVQPVLTAWHYWDNDDGSYIKIGFVEKMVALREAENLPP